MKKILSLILILALLSMLAGCNFGNETKIHVGYLAGPTGIGMAKMIEDNGGTDGNDDYSFTKYTAPNLAMIDLKAGNIDIACVSTEVAAQYYNDGADIQVLAINCLNSLCLLTNDNVEINSIYDLEGKTIYTTLQGTPKLIFKALLDAYGVSATISHVIGDGDGALTISSPDKIAPIIVQNKADIILSPVHVACNALAKPSAKHKITLDIDELWNEKFDTPIAMGCIVAKRSFVENNPEAVRSFLDEYKASLEFMANTANNETAAKYVMNSTILPDFEPARNALYQLSGGLKFIVGDEVKTILENIYPVYGLDMIGGKMPDDNFYYVE